MGQESQDYEKAEDGVYNNTRNPNPERVDDEDPNQKRKRGGGEEEEEGEDLASVEKLFAKQEVPSWTRQLTFRAFIISGMLSVLFSVIVMKLNLTTGIIPSLNVSAGLLGFFFVSTWTKIVTKAGFLTQPFTRQENTVIQTCIVASSGIAFSGGFGSYLFGMSDRIAAQSSDRGDTKNPGLLWIIGFLFVVSFLGLFSVVPLRKVTYESLQKL